MQLRVHLGQFHMSYLTDCSTKPVGVGEVFFHFTNQGSQAQSYLAQGHTVNAPRRIWLWVFCLQSNILRNDYQIPCINQKCWQSLFSKVNSKGASQPPRSSLKGMWFAFICLHLQALWWNPSMLICVLASLWSILGLDLAFSNPTKSIPADQPQGSS